MPEELLVVADELYALPLAEFTPARDELAKEHKDDKSLAVAIKKLRKASLAGWVVNLLVRRDPDQVDQMLAVGEALREAQESLDAAQLRELTKQRRQLTAAVTTSARRHARAEGIKVTQQVADQVEATLTAAMIDAEAARAVRSGLLIAPINTTGLGDLDLSEAVALPDALGFRATPQVIGPPDPNLPRKLHVVPDPDATAKARALADERVSEAAAALAAAQKEQRAARRSVEKLQAKTLQVQSQIDELRSSLATLEADLEEVDEALTEAEVVLEETEHAESAAQAELDQAREARSRTE